MKIFLSVPHRFALLFLSLICTLLWTAPVAADDQEKTDDPLLSAMQVELARSKAQLKLADMATKIEAARLLMLRALLSLKFPIG